MKDVWKLSKAHCSVFQALTTKQGWSAGEISGDVSRFPYKELALFLNVFLAGINFYHMLNCIKEFLIFLFFVICFL